MIALLPADRSFNVRGEHKRGWSIALQPTIYFAPEKICHPLANASYLDHGAEAASAGLDGLRAAIEDHVPVLQVQAELALGVSVRVRDSIAILWLSAANIAARRHTFPSLHDNAIRSRADDALYCFVYGMSPSADLLAPEPISPDMTHQASITWRAIWPQLASLMSASTGSRKVLARALPRRAGA
jgi:hypothetical protein